MASINHEWRERRAHDAHVDLPSRRLPRAILMGFGVLGLAAMAYALVPPPQIDEVPPVPDLPPFWLETTRPEAPFTLAGIPHAIASRTHTGKAGEEDSLIVGAFGERGEGGFHAHLIVERPGAEPRPRGSFYIDIVRRAGEDGVALQRMAQPFSVETKLGPLEVAETVLSTPQGMRACLVARSLHGEDAVRLMGWVCGAEPPLREANALQCLVDALSLTAPRDNPGLARLFAAAQVRRNPACGSNTASRGP